METETSSRKKVGKGCGVSKREKANGEEYMMQEKNGIVLREKR